MGHYSWSLWKFLSLFIWWLMPMTMVTSPFPPARRWSCHKRLSKADTQGSVGSMWTRRVPLRTRTLPSFKVKPDRPPQLYLVYIHKPDGFHRHLCSYKVTWVKGSIEEGGQHLMMMMMLMVVIILFMVEMMVVMMTTMMVVVRKWGQHLILMSFSER